MRIHRQSPGFRSKRVNANGGSARRPEGRQRRRQLSEGLLVLAGGGLVAAALLPMA